MNNNYDYFVGKLEKLDDGRWCIRLKDQGIQKNRQAGDLYVKINPILPENIDQDIIQLLNTKLGR